MGATVVGSEVEDDGPTEVFGRWSGSSGGGITTETDPVAGPQIAALETDLDALTVTVGGHTTTISALQTALLAVQGDVLDAQTTADTATAAAATAQGAANTAQTAAGAAQADVDALEPVVAAHTTTINSLPTTYMAKGEVIFNVKDFGALGDGVTDDAAAINAAINAAAATGAFVPAVVLLPYTSTGYRSAGIVLKSGVILRGERQVLLKRTGTSSVVYINATNMDYVGVEGLTIDANGLASSAAVRMSGTTTRMWVRNCKFSDSAQPANVHAVEVVTTASIAAIEDNWFDANPNNIRLVGNAANVSVRRNRFTNWKERCVYVLGQTGACSSDVIIEDNRCTNMAAGGSIRQAITFQGTDNTVWHLRPKVYRNTVIGLDKSYNDPVTPGTADQISLHHCDQFEVRGNTSTFSGDCGITISQLSKNGTVSGNVCLNNDTTGVALGATGTSVNNITLTGNVCMNNGQDRNNDRGVTAGFLFNGANGITATGNILVDNQTTPTQDYGMRLRACSNVRFGVDLLTPNQLGDRFFDASPNNSTNVKESYILDVGTGPLLAADFTAAEPVAVRVGTQPKIMAGTGVITAIKGWATTPGVAVLDVKKNGTSIFSVTGNRPTFSSGTNAAAVGTFPTTTYADGDRITIDVVSVGSPVPAGVGLTMIHYRTS